MGQTQYIVIVQCNCEPARQCRGCSSLISSRIFQISQVLRKESMWSHLVFKLDLIFTKSVMVRAHRGISFCSAVRTVHQEM